MKNGPSRLGFAARNLIRFRNGPTRLGFAVLKLDRPRHVQVPDLSTLDTCWKVGAWTWTVREHLSRAQPDLSGLPLVL